MHFRLTTGPAPRLKCKAFFWIIRAFLRLECERLRQQDVRVEAIGRRDRIPLALLREIERTEAATALGGTLHLRIAVDYSSRNAIACAAATACDPVAQPPISPDRMRAIITQALCPASGDVDLLIRTGGEKRLSDYLLWESAYAELAFTNRMWPDFDGNDLESAVLDFRHRERRFGAIPARPIDSIHDSTRPDAAQ